MYKRQVLLTWSPFSLVWFCIQRIESLLPSTLVSKVLLLFLLAFHLLLRIRSLSLHHAYDSSLLTLLPSPLRSRSSWSEDPRTMSVTPSQRRENQLPQGSGLEAWAPSSGGCKIPTTHESPSRSLNMMMQSLETIDAIKLMHMHCTNYCSALEFSGSLTF